MEIKTLEQFIDNVGELIGDAQVIDEDFSDVVGVDQRLSDPNKHPWYIITYNHHTGEIAGMSNVDE